MAEFQPPPGFEPEATFKPPPGFEPEPMQEIKTDLPSLIARAAMPENLRAARVVGTGVLAGTKDVAEMGQQLPINAKNVVQLFANTYKNLTGRELAPDLTAAATPTAEQGFERMGLPVNPKAEAERLKVPYGGDTAMGRAVEATTEAARFGTSAALTAAGPVASGLTAIGAGASTVAGLGPLPGAMAVPLIGGRLLATRPQAPLLEDVGNAKNAAYQQMKNANVLIAPKGLDDTFRSMEADLALRPHYAPLMPKVEDAKNFLQGELTSGRPMTLERLDQVRQVVRGAMKGANPNEIQPLKDMIGRIDQLADTLLPNSPNLIMGNAMQGTPALLRARALNTQYRKAELIQDTINNADTRVTSIDLALRNEFAKLVRNKNLMRTFTPDEQKAIASLQTKGSIPGVLRYLSRFAPSRGVFQLATEAALTSHFPGLGMTTMITTEAGKHISKTVALQNAARVRDLMLLGYMPPRGFPGTEALLRAAPAIGAEANQDDNNAATPGR